MRDRPAGLRAKAAAGVRTPTGFTFGASKQVSDEKLALAKSAWPASTRRLSSPANWLGSPTYLHPRGPGQAEDGRAALTRALAANPAPGTRPAPPPLDHGDQNGHVERAERTRETRGSRNCSTRLDANAARHLSKSARTAGSGQRFPMSTCAF